MNILILSWRGPKHPLSGGAEIATLEHAKKWVSQGNTVTLFTSYFKGADTEELFNGIRIIRRGDDAFGVKIAAFVWYLFSKNSNFDLVVDEFHGIPFFIPLYVRTKKLAFIHEVAKEVWWLNTWPKPFNYIPAIFGTLFEPLIFKFLYRNISFMTVSESTKKDLVNWGVSTSKIKVIYNGVSTVSVRSKKEAKKTLIYLGALARDKGIEDAIKVFGFVNRKEPESQFWVVGHGSKNYLNEMKTLCRKLRVESRVKFWGFVDNKTKFKLLSRSHILLNPSIREGWGLVNIEANSVGTPVVGYDVSGVRDSVVNGKTGLLSKLGNYEGLAMNVIKLFNDINLYNKMSREALLWSRKFTWEKSTNESLDLIKNLVL